MASDSPPLLQQQQQQQSLPQSSSKPSRARHQLTRSITEFAPPVKLLHHHHHQGHHHIRHHSRQKSTQVASDDRAPQSAGPLLSNRGRPSLDVSRAETGTTLGRGVSPEPGRRDGMLAASEVGRDVEKEVKEQNEKAEARVTGLKKSLADLSGFSNTTTRQLDETYYAVLEKTSALQVTVTAMRELATLSREIKGVFEAESQEMVRDVQAQVDSLGQFEEQKKRIVDLQGRIEAGRNKIQALSGRVDVVKERIEGWEKADREWQEKTRKRLKSLWIVMSVVFALLVLLLVGAKYAAPDTMAVGKHSLSGDDANESNYSGAEGSDDEPGLGLWEKRTDVQEDRLHFLDEL
ncbi:hypothetical protein HYQ45_008157 [Verticillium longisporum]|uniref:Uncharacterized protein n=1 Tax=Verticillium longisporum TaxID=100787 RepID=A0A8I3AR36_VERLO|nr:hypothetical protein HYQ45_008157 [Verticillium longisporum]RBQ69746.1 hypothetical protein VDGD_04209 [Verticillium dahliae]